MCMVIPLYLHSKENTMEELETNLKIRIKQAQKLTANQLTEAIEEKMVGQC